MIRNTRKGVGIIPVVTIKACSVSMVDGKLTEKEIPEFTAIGVNTENEKEIEKAIMENAPDGFYPPFFCKHAMTEYKIFEISVSDFMRYGKEVISE